MHLGVYVACVYGREGVGGREGGSARMQDLHCVVVCFGLHSRQTSGDVRVGIALPLTRLWLQTQ